jgi:hypothetical protein
MDRRISKDMRKIRKKEKKQREDFRRIDGRS